MLKRVNSGAAPVNKDDEQITFLNISDIELDVNQPRKHIDPEALAELADSIKNLGLIQPIIVRPKPNETGKFIITVGERRYRATAALKLEKIKAIIRESKNLQALWFEQLGENAGRSDLSAIEYVNAVGNLLTQFKLSSVEIAEAIGKSKSRVSEYVTIFQSDKRFIVLLENGVKLRPVVELCRLYNKDAEFISSHLDAVSSDKIDINFVNSLKSLLAQVDGAGTDEKDIDDTGTDEKDIDDTGTDEKDIDDTGTDEKDIDGTGTDEKDIDGTGTDEKDIDGTGTDEKDIDDTGTDEKDIDGAAFLETIIDGHKNLDLTGSFKKRSAAQAVIHVEFNCGNGNLGRGVIASTYLPVEPHLIPIELDDGSIITLTLTDCKIVGYE
ncbi:MAG: hypothetical protein MHMPM18_003405 [Marteilia pararefringens]